MLNNSIKIFIFVKLRPRFKYGKGSGEVVIVNIQLKPYHGRMVSPPSNGFAHEKRIRQMNASIVNNFFV